MVVFAHVKQTLHVFNFLFKNVKYALHNFHNMVYLCKVYVTNGEMESGKTRSVSVHAE